MFFICQNPTVDILHAYNTDLVFLGPLKPIGPYNKVMVGIEVAYKGSLVPFELFKPHNVVSHHQKTQNRHPTCLNYKFLSQCPIWLTRAPEALLRA